MELPRYEQRSAMVIVGISERYEEKAAGHIPSQWKRFAPLISGIEGKNGEAAFGVRYNFDSKGNFDYLCGVEVSATAVVEDSLCRLEIAPQKYLVFLHADNVSTIWNTCNEIQQSWPEGVEKLDAPDFEYYGPNFDPLSGNGGVEIWIPVK